jgi:hypothetical protein
MIEKANTNFINESERRSAAQKKTGRLYAVPVVASEICSD